MKFGARLLLMIPFLAMSGVAHAQSGDPIELVLNFTGGVAKTGAFSADGKYVVRGTSSGGEVSVWELSSGRKLRSFQGFSRQIDAVAFSPDGRRIAAASGDETRSGDSIRLWDVRTGKSLVAIKAHNLTVKALAFSKDGSKLLSGGGTYRGDKELAKSSNAFDSPLKLWDSRTGQLLKAFDGHTDTVIAVAFSRDEKAVLSGGWDKTVKLWDTSSGRLIRTFTGHAKEVTSVQFLPGDKTILTQSKDSTARIWDIASGRVLRTISGGQYGSLALFPDGKTLLWPPAVAKREQEAAKFYDIESGKIVGELKLPTDGWMYAETELTASADGKHVLFRSDRVVDAVTGKLVTRFGKRIQRQGRIDAVPDGSKIVVGGEALALWDISSGQLVHGYDEKDEAVFVGSASADGARVHSVETSDTIKSRDLTTGRVEFELDLRKAIGDSEFTKYPFWTTLSRDYKTVAVTGIDYNIRLFSTATGKLLHNLPGHNKESASVTFSPDGTRILTMSSREGSAVLRSVQTGELLRTYKLNRGGRQQSQNYLLGTGAPAFSPDGKRVVTGSGERGPTTSQPDLDTERTATVWDPETGELIFHLVAHPHRMNRASFSADGTRLVSAASDRTLRIWDGRTGQLILNFGSHTDNINDAKFSPDGTRVFSTSEDGTLKIWDSNTGELLATVIKGQEGAWLVLTPEGFFNASPNAAGLLSIVQGMEVYSIDQVYQSLYRPDLVREKLAGDPRGLVREAAAQLDLGRVIGSGNVPGVALLSPQDSVQVTGSQITAEADITDRGGGIGRVEWRINGVTVGVETPPAPPGGQPLRLTRGLSLDPGSNTIEVVAYNGANLVASVPVRVSITAPVAPSVLTVPGQVAAPQPSRLFVIAAGLDDYTDSRFKLGGSVRDAQALSKAFADTGNGLYTTVDVKLLTDADVTQDKLDAAFKEFAAQASPSDVFLLYLAGHGKTVNGRYYFIPRDFNVGASADEKAINTAVVTQGIAQEQWQRWFALIPARKSVILFDTCESGTLTGAAAGTKTLEQSAANDRLAQATGRTIITASSGSEVAFEGYRGHGLFTYNLLDGLERADSDGNGTIEITELATFVYSQVTTLSEQVFKKRQEPQIRIASSYPLTKQGRVLAGDLPVIAQDNTPTFQLAQTADLQIKPGNGATVVRSLNAKTAVTVIKSEGGWSLVASGGKPLGYVATRDLAPAAKAATR